MKNMNKFRYILPLVTTAFPLIAFAYTTQTLKDVIGVIADYLNKGLLLLMGLAVLVFVYYVFQYFIRPRDTFADGAKYVMWSLIGFFIILSMWGLVNILTNTFSLGTDSPGSWGNFTNLFPR
jgi:hypothetical protein